MKEKKREENEKKAKFIQIPEKSELNISCSFTIIITVNNNRLYWLQKKKKKLVKIKSTCSHLAVALYKENEVRTHIFFFATFTYA